MTVLSLAARLDLPAAGTLAAAVSAHGGQDLTLDAGEVAHLGGLGLQVLLASAREWRATGHGLRIAPRSAAFDEALGLFGVALEALEAEGAA